jgi:thymidylate synthase (FAD)
METETTKQPEILQRIRVPALEEILGKPFKVLHDGFIRLIDYMGDDSAIVQAARVSYGAGTKKVHEDRGLIRYLMRHMHTTPLEMCELKIHVRVPMDHWRQWIRHRTANVNEYSTRYSIAIDECHHTEPHEWRHQAAGNRQGSSGAIGSVDGGFLSENESLVQKRAREEYNRRIEMGVAREQARKDLPLSTFTEAYWKIDLHNLLHFLALRMDSHAQKEIRDYANVLGNEIVARWCPAAWEAFVDYRLEAMRLSRLDIRMIASISTGSIARVIEDGHQWGWLDRDGTPSKKSRERDEFEAKAKNLGITIPWRTE